MLVRRLGRLRWLCVCLTLLVVLIAGGPTAYDLGGRNLRAVSALKWLGAFDASGDSPDRRRTALGAAECATYAELVVALRSLEAEGSEGSEDSWKALQREATRCVGDSRTGLVVALAERSSLSGRHEESCRALSGVDAKAALLVLGERAFEQQEWQTLALYLRCIDALRQRPNRVSPYRVAELYMSLGTHYERVSQRPAALQAYGQASAWYPVVWSTPVVLKARLLAQDGERWQAIRLLEASLAAGADDAGSFELLRELGYRLEGEGDAAGAYCAYGKALRLAPGLAQSIAPEHWRAEISRKVASLREQPSPGCAGCTVGQAMPDAHCG